MNSNLFDNALKESKINICDYTSFTILDKIGESNSGYVEKAFWKSHGRIIALKSLKVEMDLNENIIREFVAELQTLHEISEEHHPHILQFYGIAKDNKEQALEDLRAIKKSGILDNLPAEHKTNTKNLPKDYKSVSPISDQKKVKFLDQMESSEQIEINQSVLINDEHFKLISKWINKTPPKNIDKPENSILSRAKQHESVTSSKDYGPYFRGDL
ncbi:39513_t:CDS:2, partial [Gigaspora margarita]